MLQRFGTSGKDGACTWVLLSYCLWCDEMILQALEHHVAVHGDHQLQFHWHASAAGQVSWGRCFLTQEL